MPRVDATTPPSGSTRSTAFGLIELTLGRYAASGLRLTSNAPLKMRRPCGVSNGAANATIGAPSATAGTTSETAGLPAIALRRCS